tara:strand:+ start:1096 stop:1353 length:258 start_codon:yes stop_codon:yes gene_type:complete
MFRTLIRKHKFIKLKRWLHDSKLPGIIPSKAKKEKYTGTESPRKYDYNSYEAAYKATNGNGKSIYDCENESWTILVKESHEKESN